ncbi:hypothetical protein [Variovorax sp. HW608]|uniref:hypothetical protein n=1 Tax=Variovorax sp. HW608 TaxID=1034889 RepID=UPI001E36A931|nr:hypothetical protein [Variovorax sp. HW608]
MTATSGVKRHATAALPELGGGLGGFRFELRGRQAGFQCCTLGQCRGVGVEAIRDAFQKRSTDREACIVVAVERFVPTESR